MKAASVTFHIVPRSLRLDISIESYDPKQLGPRFREICNQKSLARNPPLYREAHINGGGLPPETKEFLIGVWASALVLGTSWSSPRSAVTRPPLSVTLWSPRLLPRPRSPMSTCCIPTEFYMCAYCCAQKVPPLFWGRLERFSKTSKVPPLFWDEGGGNVNE